MWTLVDEDDAATIGRIGAFGVAILRAPIDAAFFDRVGEAMRLLAAEDGFSMLIVRVGPAPGPMSGEARDRAVAVMREHGDALRALGYVLGGGSLKARVLRGAMNAALTTASFPAKSFTDVRSAVRWMVERPGQPAALRAQADAITAEIESRAG